MVFWNIADLKKKEKEFWTYLERFDVIGLCETWMEEKDWEKKKKDLPKEFIWKSQHATREKKKGRAKGGIITGVRRGIEEIDGVDSVDNKSKDVNGVQERRLRIEGKIWRIVIVYNGEGMKEKKKELEKWMKERREEILCIGEDFNVRIGGEGKRCEEENDKEVRRSTRDKEINREGKELLV